MKGESRMGKVKLAGVVTAVLAFGVFAGCGGGDDGGGSTADGGGSGSSTSTPAADPAIAVFNSQGCAGCHTLGVADASGAVGPNLDITTLTKSQVEDQIRSGGGAMPAYEDQLSDAQISSLATLITSQ